MNALRRFYLVRRAKRKAPVKTPQDKKSNLPPIKGKDKRQV